MSWLGNSALISSAGLPTVGIFGGSVRNDMRKQARPDQASEREDEGIFERTRGEKK